MFNIGNDYFASANSGYGFKSYFKEIFGNCEHLYIIKSGPGTGKSSFLKKICKEASMRNYDIEKFHCSSDSNSLDGVLIKDINTAVIDGTAPHSVDLSKPGIYDNIINFGQFLDDKKISTQRNLIEKLTAEKVKEYNSAYNFSAAALNIDKELGAITEKYLDFRKAKRKITSLISKLGTPKTEFRCDIRNYSALTVTGKKRFMPKITDTTRIIYLKDRLYHADLYLKLIMSALNEKMISYQVSYDTLNPEKPELIYITDYDIIITYNNYEHNVYKTVNSDTLLTIRPCKTTLKEIKDLIKQKEKNIEYSLNHLSLAGKIHSEIEKIYSEYMDFRGKEKLEKFYFKKIFS